MSLAQKISIAREVYRNKQLCKLMQITLKPELQDEDREALLAVINAAPFDKNYVPNTALAQAIRDEGFDMSTSAVDRHRRRHCACYRVQE